VSPAAAIAARPGPAIASSGWPARESETASRHGRFQPRAPESLEELPMLADTGRPPDVAVRSGARLGRQTETPRGVDAIIGRQRPPAGTMAREHANRAERTRRFRQGREAAWHRPGSA